MKDRLRISYDLSENISKDLEFFLLESKDYDHFTVWETREYPLLKITQEDFHYFKSGKDIEVVSGDLDEMELEIIAQLFNEHIDDILNRPIRLDLVITLEEDDLPFEYGNIYVSTYSLKESGFVKNSSFVQIMNNRNGYAPVQYSFNSELDDRFLKIDKIEIGYKIPKYEHREQKYFSEEIIYTNHAHNGIVRGISDPERCPKVDVKVSFLSELLIKGVEMKEEIFHGFITEYI